MRSDGRNAAERIALGACPLCRTNLRGEDAHAANCPSCGAELGAFSDFLSLTKRYQQLAREYLSRGMAEQARQVIEQLPMISEVSSQVLDELRAQLALLEGELPQALKLAEGLKPPAAQAIREAAELQSTQLRSGHELYNFALSSARRGELRSAALHLRQAIEKCPREPLLWQLKLKVDLKLSDWVACYADLKQLDELSARTGEFQRLEELLPPVSGLV